MYQNKFFNHACIDQLAVYDSFICHGSTYLSDLFDLSCVEVPINVKCLDNGAFRKNQQLQKIVLHNDVSSIGRGAFFRCENLSSINLEDCHIAEIDERAFCKCTSLSAVSFPQTLTSIHDNAFAQSQLMSVDVPEHIKYVSKSAFDECEDLKHVALTNEVRFNAVSVAPTATSIYLCHHDIPEGTTEITEGEFYSRLNLSSITIPNSVSSIGSHAFWRCANLKKVTIPESVVKIEDSAFFECFNLQDIEIPSRVSVIEDDTFSDCYSLSNVSMANVVEIKNSAFRACISLSSLQLPNVLKRLDRCFYNCISLSSINIPKSVEYIGKSTFTDCISLSGIDLANCKISALCHAAFSGCTNLVEVKLPASLQLIENECFKNCSRLSSIDIGNACFQHESFAGTAIENLASF